MEKFTLFWGEAPYSQWSDSTFTVDGVEYNCAEQWMMAEKARFFGDTEVELAVLEADLPEDQKRLGRKVKDFDVDKWARVARDIVYRGNYAKFTQNPDMLETLLASEGTLVEASPYDKIWGIGLPDWSQLCHDRDSWKGLNWLGEVLTLLREDLRNGVIRTDDFPWSLNS